MTTWTVPATVVKVIDADTLRLHCDLGWGIGLTKNARLAGVDAPELRTEAGKAARAFVRDLLPDGSVIMFVSEKLDKYGRSLGRAVLPDGRDLTEVLIAEGHGQPYDGGAR